MEKKMLKLILAGLVTAAVLCFLSEARPEVLWGVNHEGEKEGRLSFKNTLIVLAVAAALTGGILALFASAYPDGLEWSMEKVAGTAELEAAGGVYESAAKIARHAHAEGLTLRESALQLGLVSAEDFDRWVRPENMVHPN